MSPTIQQTQQQLQQRRTQLEQAQQKIQAQELQLTQQQLRTLPLIQRQKAIQQFEQAKQKSLGQVERAFEEQEKYETQLQKAQAEREAQVAAIAAHQHDITVGRKFAGKPEFWQHLTKRQRKYAEYKAARLKAHSQLITQSQALKEVGLTFRELSPETLAGLELPALKKLEEAEVIRLEKGVEITPLEEKKYKPVPLPKQYETIFPLPKQVGLPTGVPFLYPQEEEARGFVDILTGKWFEQKVTKPFQRREKSEWEKKVEKVWWGIIPEKRAPTKAEKWYFEKVLGTTPGLEPISAYQVGEKPSLRYGAMWVSRKVGEAEAWQPIQLKAEELIGKERLKVGAEILGPTIAEVPLFMVTSPFMRTGAAKQKAIQKQITKTRFEKMRKLFGEIERKVIQKKELKDQVKILREYKKRFKLTDEDMTIIFQKLQEKEIIKPIPIERFPTPEAPIKIDIQLLGRVPTMEKLGILEAGVITLKPRIKIKAKEKLITIPKQKEEMIVIPKLKQKFFLAELTKEQLKQQQKLKELQKYRVGLGVVSLLAQPQILGQPQVYRQVSRFFRPTPRPRIPRPREKLKPRRRFGVELPKARERRRYRKPIPSRAPFFIPEIRRFGKWRPLGEFERLERAKRKGIAALLGTLAASLRIKKGEEILSIAKESRIFRRGKREPKVLIQRKKFRLSMPSEVAEIQRARVKAKKKLKW